MISAKTTGDGACAIHALLGRPLADGSLFCENARDIVTESFEAAFHSSDTHKRKLLTIIDCMWTELAEAKKGDRLRNEASIIWAQLNSELQEECLRAVNTEKQRSGRDVDRRRDFQAACREFFTRDIEENVIRPLAHCKGFIPSTDDIFTMTAHAKWSESQSNENSWLAEAYTRMGNEMRATNAWHSQRTDQIVNTRHCSTGINVLIPCGQASSRRGRSKLQWRS